jgi:hypothetical protein
VDRFRTDAGHDAYRTHFDGTEADDAIEPDRKWWVAAAVVCFVLHLVAFCAMVLVYGRF